MQERRSMCLKEEVESDPGLERPVEADSQKQVEAFQAEDTAGAGSRRLVRWGRLPHIPVHPSVWMWDGAGARWGCGREQILWGAQGSCRMLLMALLVGVLFGGWWH